MTTQTTTIRTSSGGMRALIGATAASLAVLGGALLWQARPASETAAPAATATVSTMSEGVTPQGGLAEQYRDQERATAAAAAARVTTAGGMAELYAQQRADRFADEAARLNALGGADAPYRVQQQADRVADEAARIGAVGGWVASYRASTQSTCDSVEGGDAC